MLPEMPSLTELKQHLTEQGLVSKCETPNNEVFAKFADGNMLDGQNSYGRLDADARFWFSYNQEDDEFVLNVSFFSHTGEGITRQRFIELISDTNVAAIYKDDYVLRWKPTVGTVYELGPATDSGVYRYFNRTIGSITKIA